MSDRIDITKLVAGYVTDLSYERIPEEARHVARRALIDTIGCAVAGTGEPAAQIALRLGRQDVGSPRSTVIFAAASADGSGALKLPPADAAMINAIAGHTLDYDDVNAMGHPSFPVAFTALAAAEDAEVSGRDLLTAYVTGVEVETKINRAFGESHYLLGWHSTSTVGVLGAAAAAAKIYRLDAEQTAMALGIAASQACGLRRNFGTMTKPFHPGHASWAGLTAARLARLGYTADASILESGQGYLPVFSAGPYDAARAVADLDKWALLMPGLSVKKYPCCYCTHASIDAALTLKERFGIEPGAVRSICAELSAFYLSPLIHHRPQTGLEGKFSLEYTLAAALLDSKVVLRSFTNEMVRRPAARELIEKVTSRAHNAKGEGLQATFARLTIELGDGSRLVEDMPEPRGAAGNPMSDGEIAAKFADCWQFRENTRNADAESVLVMLWEADRLENLADLARHLA
jgi:2-methylcitrate dehydratase PrpD